MTDDSEPQPLLDLMSFQPESFLELMSSETDFVWSTEGSDSEGIMRSESEASESEGIMRSESETSVDSMRSDPEPSVDHTVLMVHSESELSMGSQPVVPEGWTSFSDDEEEEIEPLDDEEAKVLGNPMVYFNFTEEQHDAFVEERAQIRAKLRDVNQSRARVSVLYFYTLGVLLVPHD